LSVELTVCCYNIFMWWNKDSPCWGEDIQLPQVGPFSVFQFGRQNKWMGLRHLDAAELAFCRLVRPVGGWGRGGVRESTVPLSCRVVLRLAGAPFPFVTRSALGVCVPPSIGRQGPRTAPASQPLINHRQRRAGAMTSCLLLLRRLLPIRLTWRHTRSMPRITKPLLIETSISSTVPSSPAHLLVLLPFGLFVHMHFFSLRPEETAVRSENLSF